LNRRAHQAVKGARRNLLEVGVDRRLKRPVEPRAACRVTALRFDRADVDIRLAGRLTVMEFARHFERASPARDRPVRISTHHRDIGQTRECHPEIPMRRQPLEQANNLLARNDRVLVTAEQQEQARAQP
jgi:hypothetical protein